MQAASCFQLVSQRTASPARVSAACLSPCPTLREFDQMAAQQPIREKGLQQEDEAHKNGHAVEEPFRPTGE